MRPRCRPPAKHDLPLASEEDAPPVVASAPLWPLAPLSGERVAEGRVRGRAAVFFPRTPVERAVKVVESIYDRLARTPFRFNGATRNFSASFGLASALPSQTPESLKRRADEALYEAKRQGRGRFVIAG